MRLSLHERCVQILFRLGRAGQTRCVRSGGESSRHVARLRRKGFLVCFVLDALYNGLPGGHPNLLFKGGTSLSKAFGLIERFSEDIDLVVYRDDLGFEGHRDPTIRGNLSGKKRNALFRELTKACSDYVLGNLKTALTGLIDGVVAECRVLPDEDDASRQTLFVEYPTLFPGGTVSYVSQRVKIEAGARSALDPNLICTVSPYISAELPDRTFEVEGIRTLAPERTYWEKLLILHGLHYGYENGNRLPADRDLILTPLLRCRDDYRDRNRQACTLEHRSAWRSPGA